MSMFKEKGPERRVEWKNARTPYEILGVSPSADAAEIRAAWALLAKRHHTDNGGKKEILDEINDAYNEIKTPDLRSAYDSAHAKNAGKKTVFGGGKSAVEIIKEAEARRGLEMPSGLNAAQILSWAAENPEAALRDQEKTKLILDPSDDDGDDIFGKG